MKNRPIITKKKLKIYLLRDGKGLSFAQIALILQEKKSVVHFIYQNFKKKIKKLPK